MYQNLQSTFLYFVDDGLDYNIGFLTPRSSIGKQTVAEAARATGSSLHLYRNPLNDENYDDGIEEAEYYNNEYNSKKN